MSLFGLNVEISDEKKITDISHEFTVKITPPVHLEKEFYAYSENYHNSAHLIASYLLETDHPSIGELDTYFFSLAFLYRHSIELILKAIAFKSILTDAGRASFAKDTFHDLGKILTNIILMEPEKRPSDELQWLQSYFTDLSEMDKESDSFRYPFHINIQKDIFGNKEFKLERVFEKQTHINLVAFANKFEAAFEILNLWYNDNDLVQAEQYKTLNPIFLEQGGPYYGQAVVGYGYNRQDFYPYFKAYSETAGLLRKNMIEDYQNGNVSTAVQFIMPMAYLYRNGIELSLKAIWFEDTKVNFQERCKLMKKKKHSIEGMWNSIRKWSKDFYGEDADIASYFDVIEKCCKHLQSYDTTASRFRYPCDKDMSLYYKKETTLDILSVAEFMESLISAIDGIDGILSERKEYIDEMEAEMREQYLADMSGYF